GKPAAETRFVCDALPTRLHVVADQTVIGRHEAVRVMVRVLDQAGHKLPFFPEPITVEVTGNGRRLGPATVPLRAGSTGVWVQATGAGPIEVKVHCDRLGVVATHLSAE
ncbi:MAG: glycoside hydrolase family 2 protein, partial [Cypionkella sp.]